MANVAKSPGARRPSYPAKRRATPRGGHTVAKFERPGLISGDLSFA
jgi:hypothetical protein